jgi:hypothetical protein
MYHLLRATRLAFTFFLFSFFAISTSAQVIDTASHYRIASMGQAGKSVAISKEGQKYGRPFLEATTAEGLNQRWKWRWTGEGIYEITNQQAGTDLFLTARQEGNVTNVVLESRTKTPAQFWRLNPRQDGTVRITNEEFGQALVVDIDAQGRLLLRPQNGMKMQIWKLILQSPTEAELNARLAAPIAVTVALPVTEPPQVQQVSAPAPTERVPLLDTTATYRIFTDEMPGKSLGMSTQYGQPYLAALLPTRFHKEQEWRLRLTKEGYYQFISNYNTKEALALSRQGTEYMVVVGVLGNEQTQQWKLTPLPDGAFQISSPMAGDDRIWGFVNDDSETNSVSVRPYISTSWRFVRTKPAPVVPKKEEVVAAGKSKLVGQEELKANDQLVSANGKYKLIQQEDGNLVLYNQKGAPIWASNTNGNRVKRCVMQKDGNLVQYLAYDVALWSTNTHGNTDAVLVLQDDGNLVIYSKDNRVLWASNTAGK